MNNVDSLILRECCLSSDAIVQLANALQGRERTVRVESCLSRRCSTIRYEYALVGGACLDIKTSSSGE